MGLIIIPTAMVDHIDALVADFRAKYPEASAEDAAHIRQEFVNIFADYGRIPEFTIEKREAPIAEGDSPSDVSEGVNND